jgi:hypothetical protein
VAPPRSIVAGCARKVIVGAGAGTGAATLLFGGGGGVAGGLEWQATTKSTKTNASDNRPFIIRDKVISEPPY